VNRIDQYGHLGIVLEPDVVLVAFNGFGGNFWSTAEPFPFADPLDVRWLEVFDALFSGDPRPADVPQMDFWRSMDIYSDHMVRRFEESGIPLRRIDSTAFMVGNTGTNYFRKTSAWQSTLLLTLARGGWVNIVYGNLDLLSDDDAQWFANVQAMYAPLQERGTTRSFGGIPGDAEPYGFASEGPDGALYAVVNPSHRVETIRLPPLSSEEPDSGGRILFREAGFEPVLESGSIRLGPGQFALVGFGRYATPDYDLGVASHIQIPLSIERLVAEFAGEEGPSPITAAIAPPAAGDLRIVLRQRQANGSVLRSVSNVDMGEFFVISATQDGEPLPVEIRYGKVIWSGLSWAVGEIRRDRIAPDKPIRIRLSSAETRNRIRLEGEVYRVEY
jgi:hypothetical protein